MRGPNKEKVPGKLITAGIFMVTYSMLSLFALLVILVLPFVVSMIFDIPISSLADRLTGMMNTMSGSMSPSPLTMVIFGAVVFLLLVLLIIFYSILMAHGFGMIRGRLTRKPPYILAIITFATILIPPWAGVLMILKVLTGVFMLIALKDERVRDLYDRARDPFWESRPPSVEMTLDREPVSAIVLE